jgi:hypothetical protein
VSAYNLCENSVLGGYDDWRLPTLAELSTVYSNRDAIGGFSNGYYWSISEETENAHTFIDFSDGNGRYFTSGDGDHIASARAVRRTSPLPEVTTLPATNVTVNAATLNGRIEKKGEPAYTERGFVYSATFQDPGIDDDNETTHKRTITGTGDNFSANVSGLTEETTYYVRAYATNSNGTVYGESVSFSPGVSSDVVTLQGSNLMVMKQDLGVATNFSTAQNLCSGTFAGYSDWRLPTSAELAILYTYKSTIGEFDNDWYWSSSSCNSSYSSYRTQIRFSNGNSGCYADEARVRAVRTLP